MYLIVSGCIDFSNIALLWVLKTFWGLFIPFWKSEFPSGILFLKSEKLPLEGHVVQIFWQQILVVFFYMKVSLFLPSFFRDVFTLKVAFH